MVPLSLQIKPAVIFLLSANNHDFLCRYIQFDEVFVLPAFQNSFRREVCKLAFLFQTEQFGVGDVGGFLLVRKTSVRLGSKILCGCFLCHAVGDISFHGGVVTGCFSENCIFYLRCIHYTGRTKRIRSDTVLIHKCSQYSLHLILNLLVLSFTGIRYTVPRYIGRFNHGIYIVSVRS